MTNKSPYKEDMHKVEDILFKNFLEIADGLSNFLQEKELIITNDVFCKNHKAEIYNDMLAHELDKILAKSYNEMIIKIKGLLDSCSH